MPLSRGRLCLVGGGATQVYHCLLGRNGGRGGGGGGGGGKGGGGRSNCLSLLEGAEKLPVNPKKVRQLPITPALLCCQLSFQDFSADRLRNAAEKEKLWLLIVKATFLG
jgi:hypothetical protein